MIRYFGWKKELCAFACAPPPWPSLCGNCKRGRIISKIDVYDQGATNSCVVQAVAMAIRIKCGVYPSRRFIYRVARETHGSGSIDSGTYISSAINAIKALGWPDEKYAPWDESRVNSPLTIAMRRHAYDQHQTIKEYSGDDYPLMTAIHAIDCGNPVVFGMYVDHEFVYCNDFTPQYIKGKVLGGHAMVVVGYDPGGVIVVNSWGTDWGKGGFGRIDQQEFDRKARDLRVITMADRPTT